MDFSEALDRQVGADSFFDDKNRRTENRPQSTQKERFLILEVLSLTTIRIQYLPDLTESLRVDDGFVLTPIAQSSTFFNFPQTDFALEDIYGEPTIPWSVTTPPQKSAIPRMIDFPQPPRQQFDMIR